MPRAALYLRVSKSSQTTDNQRVDLERVAALRGWDIVEVYEDVISGAKGREQRPAFDRMLNEATQGRFDVLAAWSVDRLGRSLQDLVAFLSDLQANGRDLYLHQQAIDTATPSGRALFGMLSVFAEYERSLIKERVLAGLARAKERGVKLGRPRVSPETEQRIHELRNERVSMLRIGRALGIGTSVVQRVLAAPTGAQAK